MKPINGALAHELDILPGITAVIGSGGKSTLLKALGRELAQAGENVLLATSTHMYPVAGVPWEGSSRRLAGAPWRPVAGHRAGCTCEQCAGPRGSICQAGVLDPETGKLGAPRETFAELAARYSHVIVEADGSKHRPLKAHAAWEPAIPEGTGRVVWVVGASGLGRPIAEAVHRPEIFYELACAGPDDAAAPELVARVLDRERAALGLDGAALLVNQVDDDAGRAAAGKLTAALDRAHWGTVLEVSLAER